MPAAVGIKMQMKGSRPRLAPRCCFLLVRPDRRAVAARPAHQLPRWVAPFLRFKQEHGVCLQQCHGCDFSRERWPPGLGDPRSPPPALPQGPFSFLATGPGCLLSGAWVPTVWGQGVQCVGSGCLLSGAWVPTVWGLGACCLGAGCPVCGVRVPAVWGLGAHCLGPGCPLSRGRVSSVWGLGARCLGPGCSLSGGRVPAVWGLGVHCLRSGCPACGVRVLAVWGLGARCLGPGCLLSGAWVSSVWSQCSRCLWPGHSVRGARAPAVWQVGSAEVDSPGACLPSTVWPGAEQGEPGDQEDACPPLKEW